MTALLQKGLNDRKEYLIQTIENGLEIMFISTKSAIAPINGVWIILSSTKSNMLAFA
jgi:hypothetical protein